MIVIKWIFDFLRDLCSWILNGIEWVITFLWKQIVNLFNQIVSIFKMEK